MNEELYLAKIRQLEQAIIERDEKIIELKKSLAENSALKKSYSDLQIHLETVIDSIPGNYWWKDLNSHYKGCNHSIAKLLGFSSPADIVGKTDYDLPWSEMAEVLVEHDQLVINSEEVQVREESVINKNGDLLTFFVAKAPLKDFENKIIGTIGTSIDITELKQTQEKLKIAKEKAEAANEAKEAFLRNMRHDLRTPFSGILTLAQLMADDELDQEKKENLQDIADSATVLLEYMNKILDHAQLGAHAKKIVSELVDLEKLLRESLMTITPTADAKGLKLHRQYAANLPKTVISDKWRLQRIVMNLLGNAVKFTESGDITLGVHLQSETPDKLILEISVCDTGIGIPANKYQAIFEKFTRLEAAYTGKYVGTGLGLYDVKQLCKELGGDITVSSELGKGSLFTCTLPFTKVYDIHPIVEHEIKSQDFQPNVQKHKSDGESRAERAKSKTPEKIKSPTKEIRVLLVEDNPVAAMSSERMLQSRGYIVDVAETGFLALDKFDDKNYDLILMDIGLPDINGIEVTKKIRQLEVANGLKKIPIIAVTAHPDMKDKSLKIFDYVFAKPCTDGLFYEIEQVLNR